MQKAELVLTQLSHVSTAGLSNDRWRAVCLETCTYGSEGETRRPTAATWQGAGFLPYYRGAA